MQIKSYLLFRKILLPAVILFAIAITTVGRSSAQTITPRPCDLYASATPCVAAYSTTRALSSAYKGPLYEVTRQSDKTSINIGLLPDGYANAAKQDAFCAHTACTITKIYDQSPNHNDLTPAPPGGAAHGPGPNGYDIPAVADALPVTVHGHQVYGIAISPGMGYRDNIPVGTAVNGEPEGVYMVTSALHLNTRCCFDLGNAEVNNLDNNAGHMDAINIMCHGSPCKPDAGLDMENGIYGHLPVPAGTTFVTDMGANDGQHQYAIYQGNAQAGNLTSTGIIPLPKGYQPMRQEGAIILGTGGDNSNWATGYFFEGVMTRGMPSAQAMKAVQRNIVAAKYAGQLKP
jgi:non-reducing end alpha-L-arabinofuranosidase